MLFRKNIYPHLLLTTVLIIAIVFAYFRLPNAYFEQDEWHTFGHFIYLTSLKGKEFLRVAFQAGPLSHFTPMSLFSKLGMFNAFDLNPYPYFVVSIIFHILNSITLYLLLYLLTESFLASFLGSLFFALNSSQHQAVTWLGTFEGVEGAVLFGLIGLLLYLLSNRFKDNRLFFFALPLFFISLLFKEIGVAFILTAILLELIKRKKRVFGPFFMVFFYFLLRFSYLFWGVAKRPSSFAIENYPFWQTFFYSLITLPFKSLSQILFPQYQLLQLAKALTFDFVYLVKRLPFPWPDHTVFVYDLIALLLGLVIFLVVLLFLLRKKAAPQYLVGPALIFFSILPLLVLKKFTFVIDSRYLYPMSLGFSLILAQLIFNLPSGLRNFSLFFFVFLTIFHFTTLRQIIESKVELGQVRRNALNQILNRYPNLPGKTAFLVEGENILTLKNREELPLFQSGLGQVLLVLYQEKENFPPDFFKDFFLWEINEQGYKEINDRGFGFFRDSNLLNEVLNQYNIPKSSVLNFTWNVKKHLWNEKNY